MPTLKSDTIFPTDEEDAIIVQQAKEDGTYRSENEPNNFKPVSEFPELQGLLKANRGRPKIDNPKQSISIRLSNDTLAYFKATGKGWQTRIDDILTEYSISH